MNYSRLSAHVKGIAMELFKGDTSTRGSMHDKPQKQAIAKAAWATFNTKYLPELLVTS